MCYHSKPDRGVDNARTWKNNQRYPWLALSYHASEERKKDPRQANVRHTFSVSDICYYAGTGSSFCFFKSRRNFIRAL